MDTKEFQEIKELFEQGYFYDLLEDYEAMKKLITAYEASQQQLAGLRRELAAHATMWQERMTGQAELHHKHIDILRKQLADHKIILAEWRDEWENDTTDIDLRKQLAKAQAEVAELEDMMMLNDPSNCANAIATNDGFLITIDKKRL